MLKRFIGVSIVLAAVITGSTVGSTVAHAQTSIREMQDTNSTTLSGTIVRISGDDFILDDGTGQIWIEAESRPIRRANLAEGETVTVSGWMDDNELEAYRITRANGEEIYILDD